MNVGQIINAERTTPYGFQLVETLEDGKKQYAAASEAVRNFTKSKLPCSLKVLETGEKGMITKVQILEKAIDNSVNEFEKPVETIKPGQPKQEFTTANDYKPDNRQESIITQMCIKKGVDLLIESKDEVNQVNLIKYSKLVRGVYDTMISEQSLPDY